MIRMGNAFAPQALPKGRPRQGFILTFEAVFALSVLFIAAYIIYYYVQLAQVDQFSSIRLSKYSMDFLAVNEKTGGFIFTPSLKSLSQASVGNFTRVTNITVINETFSQVLAQSAINAIPSRYCAKLEFRLANSSSPFGPLYKEGCSLTGGDYAVTNRLIVLASSYSNITYYKNSTQSNINLTANTSQSYSYGTASLTLWYKDSVQQ